MLTQQIDGIARPSVPEAWKDDAQASGNGMGLAILILKACHYLHSQAMGLGKAEAGDLW